jgi:hypothetical protein
MQSKGNEQSQGFDMVNGARQKKKKKKPGGEYGDGGAQCEHLSMCVGLNEDRCTTAYNPISYSELELPRR